MSDVRTRIGAGNMRARTVRQVKRAARPSLVVLAGAAIGIACLVFLVLHVDRSALVSSHQVSFEVENASGVQAKVDEVRFRGIPAGKITKIELRGTTPVITVDLEGKYGAVYRDAKATLRPNTPLQDMYLNILDRGTKAAGEATKDHPVPRSQTDTSVRISDVLNVFEGNERARLAHLLDNLGNGLDDRGAQLRTAFVDLVPLVQVANRITDQLGANAPLTKRLVHNVGVLTTELGRREGQLRNLVTQSSQTLSTLRDGAGDLDSTLRQLPPTMTSADRSFTAVRGVLGDLNGALTDLAPVADRLPDSLRSVRDLTAVAQPAVEALQRPVRQLVPLAKVLVPVSTNLQSSVTRLLPQVDVVETTTDVVDKCKEDLNGFMQWDASMSKFGDSFGAAPRGNAVVGAASAGLKNPYEAFIKICAPGAPIGGRPARESDKR
jgi:virulence factor Mce-like protein